MGPARLARVRRGDPLDERGQLLGRRDRARRAGRRRWPGRCAAPWAPRRSAGRARSARRRRGWRAARGRDAAGRVEAHVERAAGPEAEAAVACRPAGSSTGRGRRARHRPRRSRPSGATSASSRKLAWRRTRRSPKRGRRRPPDSGDGRPIGVETEEAAIRVGRLQDPLGVPTAAEGGVDLEASRGRREHRHDLLRQHRDVPYLHLSSTLDDRIPSGPWKRMWCGARSPALRRPGPAPAGRRAPCGTSPTVRRPDLGVIARADDDGVAAEADRVAQVGRQEDPSLPVELHFGRAGEHEALEAARVRIGDRQRRDLRREVVPARLGCGSPGRHPASARRPLPASSWTRNLAGTAIRPLSSTVCRYSPVNTRRFPLVVVRPGRSGRSAVPHFSPLWATSMHSGARNGARQCETRHRASSAVGGTRGLGRRPADRGDSRRARRRGPARGGREPHPTVGSRPRPSRRRPMTAGATQARWRDAPGRPVAAWRGPSAQRVGGGSRSSRPARRPFSAHGFRP